VKQLPKICALLGIALLLSTSFVWAQSNNGNAITSGSPVSPNKGQARRPTEILPDFQNAIRNDTYKLVQLLKPDCTQPYDDHGNFPDVTFTEFYQINEAAPIPMLDNANAALCSDNTTNTNSCPTGLTS